MPTDYSKIGLMNKFSIKRNDGKDGHGQKHANCALFVLDIDHDKYAKVALAAYAEACKNELPELHKDLQYVLSKTSAKN